MQKKIVIFLVVLISFPVIVILSMLISIMGGAHSIVMFLGKHPMWYNAFIVLIILLGLGFSLYTLKQNYPPLSSGEKSSFWQILTNIFLVFFTFWMGIFVQDLIASKNELVNNKIITFEYVDRVSPNYKKIFYSDIFSNFGVYTDVNKIYSLKLKHDSLKLKTDSRYADSCRIHSEILQRCSLNLIQYMLDHRKDIVSISKVHDSIMADYKFYLNQQMFDSISSMNRTRNFLIAVADLIEDSTKLDSIPYSVIAKSLNLADTSSHTKELAYFESIFKSPHMLYSGNPSRDYHKMAELGCHYYNLSKQEDFYQTHILKNLATYLIYDSEIMMNEMNAQRTLSDSTMLSNIKHILGNPVRTFIIFLLLTFVVSAIIIRVISPRSVKPFVTQEVYDEVNKKCEDLNVIIRQKEIELNRKRKECKDRENQAKELKKEIQERDKKIAELEKIINE